MQPRAKVYVVDDDAAVRQSMQYLVESVELQVEAYASADEFLAKFDPKASSCLVVDVRMPGMNGLELQERLAAQGATVPTIVMTGFGDVPTAVRAMKRGAFDFIEKPFHDQHMIDLIHACLAADAQWRRENTERDEIAACFVTLTNREREVLNLIVAGFSNKQAAAELGIVPKTVEAHRAKVMEKMHARSLAELVQMTTKRPAEETDA